MKCILKMRLIVLVIIIFQLELHSKEKDPSNKHLTYLSISGGTYLGADVNYVRNELFTQFRLNLFGLDYHEFGLLIGKHLDYGWFSINYGAGLARIRYDQFCIFGPCDEIWERWSVPFTIDVIFRGKYLGIGLQVIGNLNGRNNLVGIGLRISFGDLK